MGKTYIYNKMFDHTYGTTMDDLNRSFDIYKPSYNFWINLSNVTNKIYEDIKYG